MNLISLNHILRTWDSDRGVQIDIAEDHTDYIQSLCVENGWVATGGQGDKKIMVYRTNSGGKLTRKHTCCGHTGWVRKLAILGETMVSGSLDMTLRVWDLVTGHQVLLCSIFDKRATDLKHLTSKRQGDKRNVE